MITGTVLDGREAVIHLVVRGPSGEDQEVGAVIDTGFDGSLTLPPALIALLGLPWLHGDRGILADGSETILDIYEGSVIWDGSIRQIAISELPATPLLGMALLRGYKLTMQVQDDGEVMIEVLPRMKPQQRLDGM